MDILRNSLLGISRTSLAIGKMGEKDKRPFISKVEISDIEKKRFPTKHYVYVITVLWSDSKQQVICRRYSRFFSLQTSLIDSFPLESGAKNPRERIIPFLPGKILIGRSHTREVALKRKDMLNDYIKKLLLLPDHISKCDLILDFFEATKEDIENLLGDKVERKRSVKTAENISDPILLEQFIVIANFKKTERNQISLAAGDTVDVVEKHENGWWFVCLEDEQGWVPSSYLEPLEADSDSSKSENDEIETGMKYICAKQYKAKLPDELTLELCDVVDIIKKCSDGWWEVRLRTDEGAGSYKGFVPVAHLKKVPESAVGNLIDMKPSDKDRSFDAPPRKKTIKRTIAPRGSAPLKSVLKKPTGGSESPVTGRALPPVPDNNEKSVEKASSQLDKEKEKDDSIYVALRNFKTDDEGNELSVTKGESIKVIEKSPNGWWLVKSGDSEGWIPSTFIQRQRQRTIRMNRGKATECYMTAEDYESTEDGGMSFKKGKLVNIIEKDDEGWWYVSIDEVKGWVPSTYLDKVDACKNDSETKQLARQVITSAGSVVGEKIPFNHVDESSKDNAAPESFLLPRRESNALNLPKEAPNRPTSPKPERKLREKSESSFDKEPMINNNVEKNTSTIIGDPKIKQFVEGVGYEIEAYIARADYFDDDEGMLSFKKGQVMNVHLKDEEGWWLVDSEGQQGWVPANYLKPLYT